MWDKKRPEPVQPATPASSSAPPPVATHPTVATHSTSAVVVSSPAADITRLGASIGPAVRIIGDVFSEEDLFLDGEIHGSLHVKNSRLTIGPNGKAKSDLVAREIVIQGEVQGNCEASQKITIRKEGSLIGNIKTQGIVIEDDAYFKGSIDIVRNGEAAARS